MIESEINFEQTCKLLFEKLSVGLSINELIYDSRNRPADYKIISVNKAFENLTNLHAIDIAGKNALHILPGLTPHALERYGEVILTDAEVRFEDHTIVHGKLLEVKAFKIIGNKFATLFSDVTECKLSVHAEREIHRLNDALKSKNRELEEVIYSASHDLRTPLVNIQGFSNELNISFNTLKECIYGTQLASDAVNRILPILNNDIPESMEYIQSSIEKIDVLLKGLLKLSRLGRTKIILNSIDMNTVLFKLKNEFEDKIKMHNITLRIDKLHPCRGDQNQISQVFENLLENAIKYTDPDRNGIILVTSVQNKNKVLYCVEDNGIGISPKHQKNIFDIFFRINSDDAESEGLGLTIVKKIIERHNGTIRVDSRLESGSRFFVELPKY